MDNAQAQQLSVLAEKLDSNQKIKLYAIASELLKNKNSVYTKVALVMGLYYFNLYKYISIKKGYNPLKTIIVIAIIQFVLAFAFSYFPSLALNTMFYMVNYWYVVAALFVSLYYFYIRKLTPNPSQNQNQ